MSNAIITRVPPPMRGIKQAVQEVKAADPNTALTERALRRMILTGAVPHVNVGRKYLVNMNVLYSYLSNGTAAAAEENAVLGGIRKIAE
ncbi:MAG: hypothetical protein ACI38A_02210 [Candidatus Ornithomonoglobus sp.]